jgi:hypothetical protein
MRYSKKYPDDMVENLVESPWTCSDGPGSAPNEIPKGCLFLRESKREREDEDLVGLEKRKVPASFTSRGLGPTRARHPRTVHGAHADGPRGARTVRYSFQDIQYYPSPHRAARTVRVALADGPPGVDGQSGPPPRTVRPPFSFSA